MSADTGLRANIGMFFVNMNGTTPLFTGFHPDLQSSFPHDAPVSQLALWTTSKSPTLTPPVLTTSQCKSRMVYSSVCCVLSTVSRNTAIVD